MLKGDGEVDRFSFKMLTAGYVVALASIRIHFHNVMGDERRKRMIEVLKTSEPWQKFMLFHVLCWTLSWIIQKVQPLSSRFELPYSFELIGWIMGYSAAFLLGWAHINLGEQYTPNVTVLSKQRLVKTGPYSVIRHPMYLAFILYASALCLNYNFNPGFIINLFGTIGLLTDRIRLEEQIMSDAFKTEHAQYVRKTSKLIPLIWCVANQPMFLASNGLDNLNDTLFEWFYSLTTSNRYIGSLKNINPIRYSDYALIIIRSFIEVTQIIPLLVFSSTLLRCNNDGFSCTIGSLTAPFQTIAVTLGRNPALYISFVCVWTSLFLIFLSYFVSREVSQSKFKYALWSIILPLIFYTYYMDFVVTALGTSFCTLKPFNNPDVDCVESNLNGFQTAAIIMICLSAIVSIIYIFLSGITSIYINSLRKLLTSRADIMFWLYRSWMASGWAYVTINYGFWYETFEVNTSNVSSRRGVYTIQVFEANQSLMDTVSQESSVTRAVVLTIGFCLVFLSVAVHLAVCPFAKDIENRLRGAALGFILGVNAVFAMWAISESSSATIYLDDNYFSSSSSVYAEDFSLNGTDDFLRVQLYFDSNSDSFETKSGGFAIAWICGAVCSAACFCLAGVRRSIISRRVRIVFNKLGEAPRLETVATDIHDELGKLNELIAKLISDANARNIYNIDADVASVLINSVNEKGTKQNSDPKLGNDHDRNSNIDLPEFNKSDRQNFNANLNNDPFFSKKLRASTMRDVYGIIVDGYEHSLTSIEESINEDETASNCHSITNILKDNLNEDQIETQQYSEYPNSEKSSLQIPESDEIDILSNSISQLKMKESSSKSSHNSALVSSSNLNSKDLKVDKEETNKLNFDETTMPKTNKSEDIELKNAPPISNEFSNSTNFDDDLTLNNASLLIPSNNQMHTHKSNEKNVIQSKIASTYARNSCITPNNHQYNVNKNRFNQPSQYLNPFIPSKDGVKSKIDRIDRSINEKQPSFNVFEMYSPQLKKTNLQNENHYSSTVNPFEKGNNTMNPFLFRNNDPHSMENRSRNKNIVNPFSLLNKKSSKNESIQHQNENQVIQYKSTNHIAKQGHSKSPPVSSPASVLNNPSSRMSNETTHLSKSTEIKNDIDEKKPRNNVFTFFSKWKKNGDKDKSVHRSSQFSSTVEDSFVVPPDFPNGRATSASSNVFSDFFSFNHSDALKNDSKANNPFIQNAPSLVSHFPPKNTVHENVFTALQNKKKPSIQVKSNIFEDFSQAKAFKKEKSSSRSFSSNSHAKKRRFVNIFEANSGTETPFDIFLSELKQNTIKFSSFRDLTQGVQANPDTITGQKSNVVNERNSIATNDPTMKGSSPHILSHLVGKNEVQNLNEFELLSAFLNTDGDKQTLKKETLYNKQDLLTHENMVKSSMMTFMSDTFNMETVRYKIAVKIHSKHVKLMNNTFMSQLQSHNSPSMKFETSGSPSVYTLSLMKDSEFYLSELTKLMWQDHIDVSGSVHDPHQLEVTSSDPPELNVSPQIFSDYDNLAAEEVDEAHQTEVDVTNNYYEAGHLSVDEDLTLVAKPANKTKSILSKARSSIPDEKSSQVHSFHQNSNLRGSVTTGNHSTDFHKSNSTRSRIHNNDESESEESSTQSIGSSEDFSHSFIYEMIAMEDAGLAVQDMRPRAIRRRRKMFEHLLRTDPLCGARRLATKVRLQEFATSSQFADLKRSMLFDTDYGLMVITLMEHWESYSPLQQSQSKAALLQCFSALFKVHEAAGQQLSFAQNLGSIPLFWLSLTYMHVFNDALSCLRTIKVTLEIVHNVAICFRSFVLQKVSEYRAVVQAAQRKKSIIEKKNKKAAEAAAADVNKFNKRVSPPRPPNIITSTYFNNSNIDSKTNNKSNSNYNVGDENANYMAGDLSYGVGPLVRNISPLNSSINIGANSQRSFISAMNTDHNAYQSKSRPSGNDISSKNHSKAMNLMESRSGAVRRAISMAQVHHEKAIVSLKLFFRDFMQAKRNHFSFSVNNGSQSLITEHKKRLRVACNALLDAEEAYANARARFPQNVEVANHAAAFKLQFYADEAKAEALEQGNAITYDSASEVGSTIGGQSDLNPMSETNTEDSVDACISKTPKGDLIAKMAHSVAKTLKILRYLAIVGLLITLAFLIVSSQLAMKAEKNLLFSATVMNLMMNTLMLIPSMCSSTARVFIGLKNVEETFLVDAVSVIQPYIGALPSSLSTFSTSNDISDFGRSVCSDAISQVDDLISCLFILFNTDELPSSVSSPSTAATGSYLIHVNKDGTTTEITSSSLPYSTTSRRSRWMNELETTIQKEIVLSYRYESLAPQNMMFVDIIEFDGFTVDIDRNALEEDAGNIVLRQISMPVIDLGINGFLGAIVLEASPTNESIQAYANDASLLKSLLNVRRYSLEANDLSMHLSNNLVNHPADIHSDNSLFSPVFQMTVYAKYSSSYTNADGSTPDVLPTGLTREQRSFDASQILASVANAIVDLLSLTYGSYKYSTQLSEPHTSFLFELCSSFQLPVNLNDPPTNVSMDDISNLRQILPQMWDFLSSTFENNSDKIMNDGQNLLLILLFLGLGAILIVMLCTAYVIRSYLSEFDRGDGSSATLLLLNRMPQPELKALDKNVQMLQVDHGVVDPDDDHAPDVDLYKVVSRRKLATRARSFSVFSQRSNTLGSLHQQFASYAPSAMSGTGVASTAGSFAGVNVHPHITNQRAFIGGVFTPVLSNNSPFYSQQEFNNEGKPTQQQNSVIQRLSDVDHVTDEKRDSQNVINEFEKSIKNERLINESNRFSNPSNNGYSIVTDLIGNANKIFSGFFGSTLESRSSASGNKSMSVNSVEQFISDRTIDEKIFSNSNSKIKIDESQTRSISRLKRSDDDAGLQPQIEKTNVSGSSLSDSFFSSLSQMINPKKDIVSAIFNELKPSNSSSKVDDNKVIVRDESFTNEFDNEFNFVIRADNRSNSAQPVNEPLRNSVTVRSSFPVGKDEELNNSNSVEVITANTDDSSSINDKNDTSKINDLNISTTNSILSIPLQSLNPPRRNSIFDVFMRRKNSISGSSPPNVIQTSIPSAANIARMNSAVGLSGESTGNGGNLKKKAVQLNHETEVFLMEGFQVKPEDICSVSTVNKQKKRWITKLARFVRKIMAKSTFVGFTAVWLICILFLIIVPQVGSLRLKHLPSSYSSMKTVEESIFMISSAFGAIPLVAYSFISVNMFPQTQTTDLNGVTVDALTHIEMTTILTNLATEARNRFVSQMNSRDSSKTSTVSRKYKDRADLMYSSHCLGTPLGTLNSQFGSDTDVEWFDNLQTIAPTQYVSSIQGHYHLHFPSLILDVVPDFIMAPKSECDSSSNVTFLYTDRDQSLVGLERAILFFMDRVDQISSVFGSRVDKNGNVNTPTIPETNAADASAWWADDAWVYDIRLGLSRLGQSFVREMTSQSKLSSKIFGLLIGIATAVLFFTFIFAEMTIIQVRRELKATMAICRLIPSRLMTDYRLMQRTFSSAFKNDDEEDINEIEEQENNENEKE